MISLHICSSSFAAVLPAVFLAEDLERRLNTIKELEEERDVGPVLLGCGLCISHSGLSGLEKQL
jgi:hypothetical protein